MPWPLANRRRQMAMHSNWPRSDCGSWYEAFPLTQYRIIALCDVEFRAYPVARVGPRIGDPAPK